MLDRGSPRSIGSSGSPSRKWVTKDQRDILLSIKLGDIVFKPQSISEFNPATREVVKCTANVKDTDNVLVVTVVGDKVDAGKKPAEVKNKEPDVVKHMALAVKKKKPIGNVVNDTVSVKDKVHSDVVKDKASDVVKHKAPAVGKKKPAGNVVKDTAPIKDKAQVDVHSNFVLDKVHDDVVKDNALNVVKEKHKTKLPKDKPKDKASSDVTDKPSVDVVKDNTPKVVKEKHKTDLPKDKPKGKASSIVKSKVPTELPKNKAKEKLSVVTAKVPTKILKDKHKADLPKDKPKSKDKHNGDSKFPVLRSKSICKSKVKVKGYVKHKRILSKEDHSKKKFEVKMVKGKMDIDDSKYELDSNEVDFYFLFDEVSDQKQKKKKNKTELKRKRKGGSGSDSSFVNEEKLRRMLKKLKKSKKEDYNEESGLKSKKKGIPVGGILLFSLDARPIEHEFVRDWTSTLMRQRQDLETKEHVIGRLDLHDEWTKYELQETKGFTRVSLLETFKRERSYFIDVDLSFIDVGNDSDRDNDGDDVNDDGNGNTNKELNDKEPFGSNPSFGFSKVSLDDFDNKPSGSGRMEVLNQGPLNPKRMPTRASNVCPNPRKRVLKPSSYLLSPYMNKKTKVVPKITSLKFILGNSLFVTQGDNIEDVFEIRLNMETISLGLWIDANVIDCWDAILNHEERFPDAELKSRKYFFARHLKLYGHNRHAKDCGLVVELELQYDMLRQLRFKFATKILLHEINVHAENMLELANEFDKVDSLEKMWIIVEVVKNKEQRNRI
uniref:Ulp1 protease family, C-terminal catalytic domain-containing protein n=1 Tax=Tanacetum cinerariifolium TaxID=118510 RepID=A0A6L2JU67_TANCI|nr:hypothetical protein [Tanacetum cinerariifolium]